MSVDFKTFWDLSRKTNESGEPAFTYEEAMQQMKPTNGKRGRAPSCDYSVVQTAVDRAKAWLESKSLRVNRNSVAERANAILIRENDENVNVISSAQIVNLLKKGTLTLVLPVVPTTTDNSLMVVDPSNGDLVVTPLGQSVIEETPSGAPVELVTTVSEGMSTIQPTAKQSRKARKTKVATATE